MSPDKKITVFENGCAECMQKVKNENKAKLKDML